MRALNRRDFLKLSGLTGIGLAASACTDTPATPTEAKTPSPTPTITPTSIVIEVTAPPRSTPAATPLAKKPIHLVQWDTWGKGSLGERQAAWFEEEIANFQKTYPWIRIERVFQEDIGQALQSVTLPDVYFGGPTPLQQYHDKKWLCAPISDFSDFDDFQSIFPEPAVDFAPGSNVVDGKAYTAPREGRIGCSVVTFVNQNLFEYYKIDALPKNDTDFLEACRKITLDSSGAAFGYGIGFATGWMNGLFEWLGAKSFKVGGGDWRKIGSQYASNPAFLGLLELLSALTSEGLILPESYTADEPELRRLFAENRLAMLAGPITFADDWAQSHPDFTNYTVLPPLTIGGPQRYACYARPGMTGTPLYISTQSKHPEEAWLWYKWLHLPECGQRWVKAGFGLSIFPENNQVNFFTQPIYQDFAAVNTALTRIEPLPENRNPACFTVHPQPVETSFASMVQMVYDYWLPPSDIAPALEKLAADSDTNWQAALAEAQRNGADVSDADFVFADWDPLGDYSPENTGGA